MVQQDTPRREACAGEAMRRLNRAPRAYTFRRDFDLSIARPSPARSAPGRRVTVRIALFWLAAACCVVAEAVILRSLLFGRARDAEQEHANSSSRVAKTTRPAEIAWALLPAVGLLFVLYLTWRAVDTRPAPAADVSRVGATIGA